MLTAKLYAGEKVKMFCKTDKKTAYTDFLSGGKKQQFLVKVKIFKSCHNSEEGH